MATPQPADADLDEELVEHLCKWRGALADGRVSPQEAAGLLEHFETEVMPAGTVASASLRVISSITQCKGGVFGYRVRRTCKQLWARPADNVIPFPEMGGGEAA